MPLRAKVQGFSDIPQFPLNIPTAPLLRISLAKLIQRDRNEEERLWQACCDLGFFYLDLRTSQEGGDAHVDGNGLLKDANGFFKLAEELFELPVEEKQNFDFVAKGSYYGYKGYGAGFLDSKGTRDRNEFYNLSKDDMLSISEPLPAPALLKPYRPLAKSFITSSHAVVTLILAILNTRLGLPENKLQSLHRLDAVSGDQIRMIRAPPQPPEDRRTALGAHTDFGSVTVLFNRVGGLQVRLPKDVEPTVPLTVYASSITSPSMLSSSASSSGLDRTAEALQGIEGDERWTYIRPLPGHAIVNLGDALVKFTAGILRSNIHRVVSPPEPQADTTRYSVVYFARPEDDVILRPLKESEIIKGRASGEEEEISSKEWILRRALGRRQEGETAGYRFEDSKGTEEARGSKG